ncbi:MAG: DNA polymerase II [Candidatus Woesearchaeota archaeon]
MQKINEEFYMKENSVIKNISLSNTLNSFDNREIFSNREIVAGFIVYPTYRIINNKAYIYLFGRLEDGDSFLTINHYKPYFYVRKKDKKKVEDLLKEISNLKFSQVNENSQQHEKIESKNLYDSDLIEDNDAFYEDLNNENSIDSFDDGKLKIRELNLDYDSIGEMLFNFLIKSNKKLSSIKLNNNKSISPNNRNNFSKYLSDSEILKLYHLKNDTIKIIETQFKNFFDENVIKIELFLPKNVSFLRDILESLDIITYEADIRFVYRFLIDKDIKGALFIKGDYKKGNYVNRIYKEPEIFSDEEKLISKKFNNLRTVSIDIESSMDLKELYCISLYSKDFKKTLVLESNKWETYKKSELKLTPYVEIFQDEKSMLLRFKEIILNYDPDIITGWNLIDFDFKVLKNKFDEHKIDFILGRANWQCTLKIYDSFFKDSVAEFPGRMVLDAMHLLKSSFVEIEDYKLQTAAKEILGESKLLIDEFDKGEEIENLYLEDPLKLVEYNLKDAELVLKILEKKNIIELTILRSLLTGMQLDRVKASIASLDSLYIRETKKLGYVCPNSANIETEEKIKGGYVREPIPGIYDFINVHDFKSLYPSIIRTFNIDPLSFIPKEIHKKFRDDDIIIAPNGARFRKKIGILPKIIEQLWKQRDIAKKEKNQEKSYAIKITMNSFFGVLANPTCRFYSLDMANAITHFGQFIVKKTAEIVDNKGYRVIYGDTDSIFIETKADNYEKAQIIGKEISDYVNNFWTQHVKNTYDLNSFLELQFEKTFIRFIMPKIRGTDQGAKKRYAGLIIVDGKEKIDFRGLEFVRRDWTELSKKFQLELLDRIFHKKEVFDYIKQFVSDLKNGKYDDLLIYKKAIRKELDNYTKTTPPHVKAARKLEKLTSNVIAYVMTSDGPEPIQNIKHSIDYEHYIEKQLKPIADSILTFYNTSFDTIIKESKQTSLFGFQ